ncbi:MAG: hypothetical protein HWE14_09385 [Flavobacteriia bacterium]|nr:hypothetical protein [Flavobacteriia bacterium]
MNYVASKEDREFMRQVESFEFPVPEFDHRAHVRLVYTYLVDNEVTESVCLMRDTIISLLKHVGVEPSQKYHETLTKAWVLAVHHLMKNTDSSESADDFIEKNKVLLDSSIMMTHYSAGVLFSEQARSSFVAPDLDPIPRHGR